MKLFGKTAEFRLNQSKLDLIDHAFSELGIRSFADLGGVWGVEGGYSFHALDKHDPDAATMVDTHPTEVFTEKAARYPQLRIIQGNFGDRTIAGLVGKVDAVILYDVLLHQVNPDWDEVLGIYAPIVRHFIIYNQQWTRTPESVRLLDLGEKEYFENVPHNRRSEPYRSLFSRLDDIHPDHDRPWRDVHHVWQWGITERDMKNTLENLGFEMRLRKDCGRFGRLKNFRNFAYIFSRSDA